MCISRQLEVVFCFFKTKQIRFPVPLFLTFTNCKKVRTQPERKKKSLEWLPHRPREQLLGPLPSVRVSRSRTPGSVGWESGGWSRSREGELCTDCAGRGLQSPRRRHPHALLQDPHEDAHQTLPATPHTSGPGPYRPSAYRHHLDPNRIEAGGEMTAESQAEAPRSVGGRAVGEGSAEEAARRRRTCCKRWRVAGAACGSPELSVRAGAPASPEPTSGRAPVRGFVCSALATARAPSSGSETN